MRLLVRGDFMAVPFENRNFHKEMLKLAGQLQKEGKVPKKPTKYVTTSKKQNYGRVDHEKF